MAARTSFANTKSNIFSRKFGGTNVGVADPYVTGYHFIYFDKLPNGLIGACALKNELVGLPGNPIHCCLVAPDKQIWSVLPAYPGFTAAKVYIY